MLQKFYANVKKIYKPQKYGIMYIKHQDMQKYKMTNGLLAEQFGRLYFYMAGAMSEMKRQRNQAGMSQDANREVLYMA